MSANDIQHGGAHYKKMEYQHWDFGCDLDLHGLIWCASKYVSRWRDKAGVLDLQKSVHFLEKAVERDIPGTEPTDDNVRNLQRFIGQLPEKESEAVYEMVIGNYAEAIALINELASTAE